MLDTESTEVGANFVYIPLEGHFYGCGIAFFLAEYRQNQALNFETLQCIPLNGRTILETNRFIYHNEPKSMKTARGLQAVDRGFCLSAFQQFLQ